MDAITYTTFEGWVSTASTSKLRGGHLVSRGQRRHATSTQAHR